jgi:hypothetical protein
METLRGVIKMKKLFALLTLMLALVMVAPGLANAADSDVIINEFVSHPSAGNEWIELHNYGTEDVDLNGWTLKDQDGDVFKIWSVSTILPAKGFIVAEHAVGALVDAGDIITLNNEKAGVDAYTQSTGADDVGAGKSEAYIISGSSWEVFSKPTKGISNVPITNFASSSPADEAVITTRIIIIKIQNDVTTDISSSSVTMDSSTCTAIKNSKVDYTCTGYGDESVINYYATIVDVNGQTGTSDSREFTTAFTKSVAVASPTVQKSLDEDAETTAEVTITLTNNGESPLTFDTTTDLVTVSDLRYSNLDSSSYATDRDGYFIDSSKVSIDFGAGAKTTINPTEQTTIVAKITLPKEGDLDLYGTYTGSISLIDKEKELVTPIVSDLSVIVNPPWKSGKLDIDVDFDDDTQYRTNTVDITVTIDNKHSEKAKNIKVEMEIPELDVKEEASKFSLDDGDENDVTFEFDLEDDVDAGNYPIYIYVTGESEDSDDVDFIIQNFDVSEELEIDVESDDLIVESVKISDDELRAGESFVATVKVANIGTSDQDDVRVRFECSDLDFSELSDITDELRDGKTLSKVFNLKVPTSADDGDYLCEVAVMYDGYKDQEDEDGVSEHLSKEISLKIAGGLGNDVEDEDDDSILATVTGTSTASIAAGSEARFILNLKNTASSGSETYEIDFEGISWAEDARIEPEEITIPAGTDVPFYAYVTPAEDISGTKTAKVVVYADGEEVASKTLTITVRGDGSGIQVNDLGNQVTGAFAGPISTPTAIVVAAIVAGLVVLGSVYMFTIGKKL